jgi:ABC-type nickel/cobalt efflux system permease component RcnA
MTDFASLLQQGNAWLFVPSAIALGALHGLEPGHSKTMMAAFIVAVRGTVAQAVLLGLAATASHTAVVWVVALGGLYFGRHWDAETTEPYFQLASGALIISIAAWMLWRTWREQHAAAGHGHHHHDHGHDHHHHDHGHEHGHHHGGLDMEEPKHQDAHQREHANDIRQRFANRDVTTGQIVMFGLTGGLIPCPASITVLLLCLQLKQVTLGAALVLCFSIGLALTMVSSGVLAAWSVNHVSRRWSGFGGLVHKAPYLSSAVIVLVGLYVGSQGAQALW